MESSSNPPPSQFQCSWPECTQSYQRREHLNRHLTKHLQIKDSRCPYCEMAFGRSDSLRRHVSRRHKDQDPIASRALRACTRCQSRKTQCSSVLPCSSCLERGWSCSYQDGSTCHPQHQQVTSCPPSSIKHFSLQEEAADIDRYIGLYFTHFHPKWSFLHKATFRAGKESHILAQSMVMAGLWFSNEPGTREAAICIHKTLMTCIRRQRDKWDISALGTNDAKRLWPMATYQAILVNIILPLTATPARTIRPPTPTMETQSLDSNRLEDAFFPPIDHTILLALVKSCLKRGMFSYPAMLAQYQQTELTPHTALPIWIGIEEAKRFALTLWHVWSLYCASKSVGRDETAGGSDGEMDMGVDVDLDAHVAGHVNGGVEEISCRDLQFSVPVSGDMWNADSLLDFVQLVEGEKAKGNQICDNEMNWICNWVDVE